MLIYKIKITFDEKLHRFLIILPTTFKYPLSLLMGSVLIWHIYHPLSDSWTLFKCNLHCLLSCWESDTLWFLVMIFVWIVNMVWVSTRTQATWFKELRNMFVCTYSLSINFKKSHIIVNSFEINHLYLIISKILNGTFKDSWTSSNDCLIFDVGKKAWKLNVIVVVDYVVDI